ncbi:MAG: serine/threonine-protein kinase [Kofleriaceae bacterium]
MTGPNAVGSNTTSRATPLGTAEAQDRIRRHQQAADVLRARSVLVAACALWVICGAGLDLSTHHVIGTGSLAFVLIVRFATTAFHVAIVWPLFRSPPLSARTSQILVTAVFPVTSFALMLIATHQGGLTSPYATAVFVIVMGQTIAWPAPWRRGALLAAMSALVYPIGLLVAASFDPQIAAQLQNRQELATFAVYVAVIFAGAIVAVWGGHVIWSLKQSVFESRKLGRYRLLRRIGQGGMGEVWRAEDRALRRGVALKILSPEHGKKPSRVARFEREIQATAAVSHPNVVRIHDWGVTDDGVWYYAMDLLEGKDLGSVVRKAGLLPPALVVDLFFDTAKGLAAAHRAGVIHRDIKPPNLFVVAPDAEPVRLELLDFGIARMAAADLEGELTGAGHVMGTPGFMAPEVVAGAPATVASDLYGLAASMYFALAGSTPRDANNAPVSELIAGIPPELDDAIERALDSEPSRRPASADDFAATLARCKLSWMGGFSIDRAQTQPVVFPPSDPTVDPEAPPTQVERQSRSSLKP